MSEDEMITTDLTQIDSHETSEPQIEVKDPERKAVGAAAGKPTTPKDLTTKVPTPGVQKSQQAGTTAPVIPAAYVPNLKFKVLDQEKEFDEWLKPVVKDKETEDKVRDLLTKSHGLSKIKTERDQLRTEFDSYKNMVSKEATPVVQQYQKLNTIAGESRQTGDWGPFFHAAQIPLQSIIRWAADTVVRLEKDPNYLSQSQSTWKTHSNLNNLQTENERLRQEMESVQTQRTEMELEYSLKTPETQNFAEAFDARMGTPGAFRNEVIRRGALIEMSEKRVASPQEIVEEMKRIYGGMPQAASQPTAPQGATLPEGTPGAVMGSEGKPVLPNVKGRSNSPAKTLVRSTDDLRKIYAQRSSG